MRLKVVLTLVATGFFSGTLFAEGKAAQFGTHWGLGIPDLKNTQPTSVGGIRGLAFVSPTWGLGGYFFTTGQKIMGGGQEFQYTMGGVQVGYAVPSGTGQTLVSFRYGITKTRASTDSSAPLYSPYHFGLAINYDYLVLPWLSVGFEGSYVGVQQATTTTSGTETTQQAFNILTFLLSLSFQL